MSKFIELNFLNGKTESVLILNTDFISTYVKNSENSNNTIISSTDRAIPPNPFLNVIITESKLSDAIAKATDSPNSYITINCGDQKNGFFDYKISVSNISAISICTDPEFAEYNQIYMPNISKMLLTSETLSTIFSALYA